MPRGVEQIPSVYDALMAVADRIGLWKLRAWLTKGATGLTLELGCGTGRNLPRYPRSARLFGIDPSLDSLRRARRRAPGVPLVCATGEALPFRRGAGRGAPRVAGFRSGAPARARPLGAAVGGPLAGLHPARLDAHHGRLPSEPRYGGCGAPRRVPHRRAESEAQPAQAGRAQG